MKQVSDETGRRARDGDPDAVAGVLAALEPLARRYARRMGSWLPADDLVADGLVAALEALPRWDPDHPSASKVTTFLFTRVRGAMSNSARDYYPGLTPPRRLTDQGSSGHPSMVRIEPEEEEAGGGLGMALATLGTHGDPAETVVEREFLAGALAQLSDRHREILTLAYLGDVQLTDGEVAEVLDLHRTRVNRLRNEAETALREVLVAMETTEGAGQ